MSKQPARRMAAGEFKCRGCGYAKQDKQRDTKDRDICGMCAMKIRENTRKCKGAVK